MNKTDSLDVHSLEIGGMRWCQNRLWLAVAGEPVVAAYDPDTDQAQLVLRFSHPVTTICPSDEGLWIIAGGGKLGRRVILWSLDERRQLREFDCPDGAAGGMALEARNVWLTHPNNRKLFCLDRVEGKVRWMIRTSMETYSPDYQAGALWLVERDPGPLGHWGRGIEARCFFIRYDTARETVAERLAVPFTPRCMALDGERFWYAEEGREGFASIARRELARR